MVMTARNHNSTGTCRLSAMPSKVPVATPSGTTKPSTRTIAAKPATFGITASIAAAPADVPWYTSGA